MTLEEQYQQDMNDLKALKGLIIQLSLPSLDLPINKPKLSVSMTLKVIESLQHRIWEIESKYPTDEQLDEEHRLQEEWDAITYPSDAEIEFEQSLLD
jgi:hypothetical protein